eukprot:jgi/Ulvmu1/7243/UM035_0030.1
MVESVTVSISAQRISKSMLATSKVTLNEMAAQATIDLITHCLDNHMNITMLPHAGCWYCILVLSVHHSVCRHSRCNEIASCLNGSLYRLTLIQWETHNSTAESSPKLALGSSSRCVLVWSDAVSCSASRGHFT